jgi:hypothetical protein
MISGLSQLLDTASSNRNDGDLRGREKTGYKNKYENEYYL